MMRIGAGKGESIKRRVKESEKFGSASEGKRGI